MRDCDRRTSGRDSVRSTPATIILTATILTGCGGGGTGPTPPPPPPAPVAVTSIVIAPDTTALVPGGTRQFIATTLDEAGNALTDRTVIWAATTRAATASTSGLVTALSPGTGYITATSSEGLETQAMFTVLDGAVIGANGGAVTAASGAVALSVPEGALTQSTTITIKPEGTPPASKRLVPGTAYEFGPDGATFMQPVTIKLRYGVLAAANKDQNRLRLHRYVNSGWVEVPGSTVNVVERTVTGQASAFSTYAILELPPAP